MYLVVKRLRRSGSCYIVEPNKLLTFDEAIALAKMNARTNSDGNEHYFICNATEFTI